MKVNTNNNVYDSENQDFEKDLDGMLKTCRPARFDNSRIKARVHEKIMMEKRARRRVRRFYYMAFTAAACIAVAVTLIINFMKPGSIDLSTATLAEATDKGYNEVNVGPGKRMEIMLPDGSRLIANANTRVLYPDEFRGDERRVYAFGEVYLQVTKDPARRFIVESEGFEVKVYGTTFNVCNTTDSTAQVVLVEGSVEVATDSHSSIRLQPDDMAELESGEITSLHKVDAIEYTLWADGLVSLHGVRLSDVVARLNSYYGIGIELDGNIADEKIYGKLDLHDSIDNVLLSIQDIVPVEILKDGTSITMRSITMN